MAETVDEFFADDGFNSTNLRPGATAVKSFLDGHSPVSEAVQSLSVNDAQSGVATLSEVLDACIVGVAEQLPETHEALVELTVALRAHEQTKGVARLTAFDHGLAMSLDERWLRYGDPGVSDRWRDEAHSNWTNLNHFAALLYAAGLQNLASFGEATLEMSLKRSGWRSNSTGPENTTDDTVALQGHAPAAADWIIITGQRLYHDSEKVRAKWTTWTADLAWIAGQDSLNSATKALCNQALTVMQSMHI